jgi:hypothetical protein
VILSRHVPASVVLSALCVTAAVAAAGSALWGALVLEPLPAARPAYTSDSFVVSPHRSTLATDQVLAAVEKDPFRADRRRPATAFRLQTESGATHARAVPAAAVTATAVRVIGTAVLPQGGGFAICQRTGGSPTLVRLGGTLGDLTLKAVEPGAATFLTAAGATLVVRVAQSGGGS